MAEAHDGSTRATESSSCPRSDTNDAGDFECNICFDLAQDPVITLCGHLYCWPCLYRWLRGHSHAHECPVCKALVEEEKVIPLYGRGKTPVDPRSKPVPGSEIPSRPAGQRPETAPSEDYNFTDFVTGMMGGFMPIASATFSNIGMSAGFGGMFFPFLSVQLNGFPIGSGYHGSPVRHQNGYSGPYHNREGSHHRETTHIARSDDENLKMILLVVLLFVLFAFLTV